MTDSYTIKIHNRQTGDRHTVQVPEDRYILQSAENQGVELPFSCRNGACTACAVRVKSGELHQPEAMGLSVELQKEGYALLCVSYPRSNIEVETQDEDEVYELQFGRYFGKGKVRAGLPLDEE
ncbi:MAG: 2Fe-2S iron-sulfur cluster binding domain-containing protein [Cyanobacteria bacterium 0813]|nr:2Fe-2S iron-sulfur cluster binding domain-containing protein [Cyanobacteria bacterium 0813]